MYVHYVELKFWQFEVSLFFRFVFNAGQIAKQCRRVKKGWQRNATSFASLLRVSFNVVEIFECICLTRAMFIVSVYYLQIKRSVYGVQTMAFYFCDITWQIQKMEIWNGKKICTNNTKKITWRLYKNRTMKKFYLSSTSSSSLCVDFLFVKKKSFSLFVCLFDQRNFFSSIFPLTLLGLCLVAIQ